VRNAYPSLIDAIYQGRGYGRAAMELVLEVIGSNIRSAVSSS
jgi:hypothetical protein